MEVTEAKQGNVSIVEVKGRVDATTSGPLEQRLLALLATGEHRLVLDLAGMDYISSAGLRVLLVVAKKLTATGGKFGLAAAKEHIKEVLDLAGFIDIFPLYDTRDQAVAAMQ